MWTRKAQLIQKEPRRIKVLRQRLLSKGGERRSFNRHHHNMTIQQSLTLLNSLLVVGPRGELLKCMLSSFVQFPTYLYSMYRLNEWIVYCIYCWIKYILL